MADERPSGQERTEDPTPRRLEQARREGQVARSPEVLAACLVLVAAVVITGPGGAALAAFVRRTLAVATSTAALGELSVASSIGLLRHLTLEMLLAMAGVFGCVMLVVPAVGLLQTRGAVSWKPLAPDWSRISPLTGLKRLFGLEALVGLGRSIAKIVILALVAWRSLSGSWAELSALAELGVGDVPAVLRRAALRLVLSTGLAFLVIALADWAFQWYRQKKALKMSRQEVVRDLRETEGDPLVKARQQSIARARARQRMLQQVPRADVVVVNPVHVAVALRYDLDVAPAPVVVAMGRRKLAERIKALALQHGVPIVENPPVARALIAASRVGQPIPPALYTAIAEILAWVYRRRGDFGSLLRGDGGAR